MSAASDFALCRELLPGVSRTFALTIRVLPERLRDAITVAYLLCRIADLFEDASELDPRARIVQLEAIGLSLEENPPDPREMTARINDQLARELDHAAGMRLLEERETVFRAYVALPEAQRQILGRWIQAMAMGMASHVGRELRPLREGGVRFALETEEELRRYAYYVAGTVGHLLTELFALDLGRRVAGSLERMRALATPFGLGLQFTNILQDVAEDRRRGWSYVPEEVARRHGTSILGLDDPGARGPALRVIADLVREAAAYLDQALEFTLLLPRSAPRVRLFCLWPTFFALRTLGRIYAEERVLQTKVRISRQEVRGLIGVTSLACVSDAGLGWLYRQERARLTRRMELFTL